MILHRSLKVYKSLTIVSIWCTWHILPFIQSACWLLIEATYFTCKAYRKIMMTIIIGDGRAQLEPLHYERAAKIFKQRSVKNNKSLRRGGVLSVSFYVSHIHSIIDFCVCFDVALPEWSLSQERSWSGKSPSQLETSAESESPRNHQTRGRAGARLDQWETRASSRWPITTQGPALTVIDLEKLTWILTRKGEHQTWDL